MSKYMIYNIQWDISDEDCNLHEMIGASLGLPDVFEIWLDEWQEEDPDMIGEILGEQISDMYGFCHFGFEYDKVEQIFISGVYFLNLDVIF